MESWGQLGVKGSNRIPKWGLRIVGTTTGALLAAGLYSSGAAHAYSGSAVGTSPPGTPVALTEFVNDGVAGRPWND